MIVEFMRDLQQRSMKLLNPSARDIHVYRILTSLRGPDSNAFDLKWLTTARIRGVIFVRINVVDLANWQETAIMDVNHIPLNESERKYRDKLFDTAGDHFRDHIYDAYSSIKVLYDYDLVEEKDYLES